MTALYLLSLFNTLEQEHAALFLLIDLTLKSSAILLLACFLAFQFRRRVASDKSVLWMVVIISLLLLPVFQLFIPGLPVSIVISDPRIASSSPFALQNILQLMELNAGSLSMFANGVVIIYLTISILLALYLVLGLMRISWLSRNSIPVENPQLESILHRLKESNGICAPVDLVQTPHCQSPLTWGLYRHRILLPTGFESWSEKLIEQTLSHELAHIQRRDWLCFIISRVVICIYWINPLVWLAHNKLIIESEKACDDAAVDDTGCSINYAENLLYLANTFKVASALAAPGLLSKKSALAQRIQYILNSQSSIRQSDRSCLLSALFIIMLIVAPFSALKISVHVSNPYQARNNIIPVNFIPKNSIEYRQFMTQLGRS